MIKLFKQTFHSCCSNESLELQINFHNQQQPLKVISSEMNCCQQKDTQKQNFNTNLW